ncbi:CocE/NonD family hydrolase [Azospirillum canadense]|uniref:CocE/NonD family hydrolase n=1 Tax=Azospirillum canadense TaxID=403962 RepID=UPI00222746F2|nr:CocE/NonD family hydrolase [Azospirillum canadense]MCW2240523.1 putative CocE/NonD family hydrolase [Azospirillum canadense]
MTCCGFIVDRGVAMAAGDGTILMMDVYRPAVAGVPLPGAFPVLLERTPYGRASPRVAGLAERAAERGYVFVAQDVRGRGESGGHFHMLTNTPDEGADGADTVAWLHLQPWCDGRIGTVGGSFSAANQQALALHRPRGLRAQVLRDAGTNYYRRMLRTHGAFNVGMVLPWVLNQALDSPEAATDPHVAAALAEMRGNLSEWIGRLPLRRGETPLALVPAYEDIYFTMLETSDDVPYWHNPTARLEGRWDEYPTDVAILLISGWFAHHAAANVDKLRELGHRLTRPVRLVIGPWIHGPDMIEATHAGEADFGVAAADQGPLHDLRLDWFDRFVLDVPGPAVPPLTYFVMGTGDGHKTPEGRVFHGGEWRHADAWPPAGTTPTPFYLHDGGVLASHAPKKHAAQDTYDFDPADPCPGIGATNLQSTEFPEFVLPGPRDQRCRSGFAACRGSDRPLAERPDVLVYQTEPLAEDTEVTGDLEARLWVASSAPDTDFMVRLIDVYPDGGSELLIAEGVVRMRYRGDRPTGALIVPGRTYAIAVELGPTSNVFKREHRIRLDITSSSVPEYDVNPNTGEPLGRHTHMRVARQTIWRDAYRPSHLLVPLATSSLGDATSLSRVSDGRPSRSNRPSNFVQGDYSGNGFAETHSMVRKAIRVLRQHLEERSGIGRFARPL